MRYWEIVEASEAEHDAQERAEAQQKLDNARRTRTSAAQTYHDRVRDAAEQERKAKARLAEVEAEQPDDETKAERWKRYWAYQQRVNKALAADAEQRSKGLDGNVSAIDQAGKPAGRRLLRRR